MYFTLFLLHFSHLSSSADAILCAPGTIHEIETKLISGRLLRVYKNLWPSLRDFWLASVKQHSEKVYLVFEEQRFTYQQIHSRAAKLAAVFKHKYGIQKGYSLQFNRIFVPLTSTGVRG
jgi:hypothetical protein